MGTTNIIIIIIIIIIIHVSIPPQVLISEVVAGHVMSLHISMSQIKR